MPVLMHGLDGNLLLQFLQNADAEEVGPRLQRMGREMERLKEQRQEAVRNLRVSQANVGKAQQMLAHMQQESQQATERTAELRTELQSTHAVCC